ncbi:uncharacterized protein JCM6883_003997 [Sporobolomyces salmoneus]|uniref:uncharacterized protein n=1 Tax=Sporobolomyces salmoneus TaxID=183962 RepID=UPI00316D0AA7
MEVDHALGGGGPSTEYYEDFDSSEDHSSPSTASDSAYSATSHPEWALDLGLSIPTLHQGNWTHNSPFKAAPSFTHTSTSSSNYWNNHSNGIEQYKMNETEPVEIKPRGKEDREDEPRDDTSLVRAGSRRSIEMEFDDMINEDSCGPSTGNSPLSLHSHSPTMPATRPQQQQQQFPVSYSHISMPAIATSPPAQPHSYLASAGLALQLPPPSSLPPLDNGGGGIAPSLTGGQPTPPLGSPITHLLPEIPESKPISTEESSLTPAPPPSTRPTRERRTSARASGLTRSATHSASSSRERTQVNSNLPVEPSSSSTVVVPGSGINLVSREAVQVTQLIPNQSNPPVSNLTGSGASSSSSFTPPVKLLVLGVPTHGAKSRVETQIKISLSLVRPLGGGGIKREGSSSSSSSDWAENLINEEGSIDSAVAPNELERIGSWSHIRIPRYLALKSRTKEDGKPTIGKKVVNPGPPPPVENTLVLDVAVVRASDPSSQIFICTNCRARELKRSLRKKDPKGKSAPPPPVLPIEDMGDKDEEEEKRKVVVFNSPEYVDFGTGECVLPTRVTCYCRHHKEKKGFCVTYSLRDHLDNIVASGMTPPIMITDDHKTSVAKQAQTAATAQSTSASSINGVESKRKAPSKVSPPSSKSTIKKEKAVATSSTSTRSRRTGGRSRRGASESTDATGGEDEVEPASKKAKPYDVDARPKKRQSPGASRHSPAFAMTPLHSAPTTTSQNGFVPPAPPLATGNSTTSPLPNYGQTSRGASPVSQYSNHGSFASSALGLDGVNGNGGGGDAIMNDSIPEVRSPAFIPPASFSPRHSISTESSLPPQHQSHNLFDWRSTGGNSTISTPPLSPGATTPSVHNENYNSLFGSFPSPVDPQQQQQHHIHHAPPPVSSIPSFAIPATEPLQSLTSTWAFQQALQQQQQEIAASMPPPRINRLIPGEGPVSGGIEVTILGENFVRDLTCLFGDSGAVSTHFWSTNTLVCVLPPSANPGPVFVGMKGVLHNPEQGGLPLFTYKDNSDRNLLELALQVVGLKMTGRLEDASAVAMRIVGNSPQGGGGSGSQSIAGAPNGSTAAQDTATLAATLNAAATSAYATPLSSRPSSRRTSFSTNSPASTSVPVLASTETRNFEGIVIKFLSLLDLDPSLLPGAAPSLPSASPPISQPDAQQHTLLHLATVLGFHRLVAFLLARGIDFDAADRNGYTALHFAALYGRVAIARQLLDAGADVALKTFAGKTAIEIAQDRDDVDVEELLLRSAPSTNSLEQVTPRISSRRPLLSFSPASYSRPTSLYGDSEDEESFDNENEISEIDGSSEEGEQSDWSLREESEREESSDWPTESDEESDAEVEKEEEDEITHDRPARSRNASTISLHYLLEAEAEENEKSVKTVSFGDSETVDAVPSTPKPSPSTSSSWLSKKLKPTVQPGLDKLQPLAGGVTNAWEKAKANRFALPQMHMPELATFPAMPAALTRRRRSGVANNSAGEETDAGEESGWEGASRHWRALYSGQWWHKTTPSSPPPQYTPSDSLYLPNSTDPDEKVQPSASSPSSSTCLATRALSTQKLSRRSRRKLSVVSDDTDDTASIAASEFEEIKHDGNDRMLWFFWIPVLLFVLTFAYLNFQVYLTPVLETLADTILPQPLANWFT